MEMIVLIIILSVCLFSYFQIIHHDFIRWDDDKQITDNSYVKNMNLQNITHNLGHERYTFLTLTSFSVIYNLWKNNPVPFHWFSIILHLLNVLLVFLLSKKLSKNLYTICFVVLLFALHPMRVESVAWISEAKDLLFTFFALCSFLFYIKYLQNNCKIGYFLVSAILALLASFSKIQGLLVPFSFFLFDIYFNRKFSVSLVLEKLLLFLFIFFFFQKIYFTLLVIGIVFYFVFRKKITSFSLDKKHTKALMISAVLVFSLFIIYYLTANKAGLWSKINENRNVFTFFERFLLAGFALWFYIKNLFLPVSLNAVHPYPQHLFYGEFPHYYYFTLIVLLIVLVLSIWMILKRKKIPALLFFGWFFFLVNISMVLHFVPIEGRLVVADRYSYLAYFGLFLIIAYSLEKLKKYFVLLFTGILILFSVMTYSRSLVWKDTLTLFTDVLKKNPRVPFAYLNMGGVYLNKRSPDSALVYFNESIKQDSLDPAAYFNRALTFFMLGKPVAAISDFNQVIHLSNVQTDKALVYTNMGEIYQKTGKDSLALKYYLKSIEMDSSIAASYNNRGMYYFQKNDLENAFRDFDKAVSLDPDYADAWNNRGWVLTAQGNFKEALSNFDRSLKINPDYAMALNNRGYLKFKSNDYQGALSDYNKALKLDSNLTEGHLNRGWVYSSMENYKMAETDYSFVLRKIKNHQTALTNRAFARFYMKDYKNAIIDFEEAVKYYPNSATNHQNLGWFKMQMKEYEKAIEEFNVSVKYDSTLINSYLNMGWIWMEKKNIVNAEQSFTKALTLNPQNGEVLYWLGELNRQKGKMEVSCYYYNQASILGNKQAKYALELYCKK